MRNVLHISSDFLFTEVYNLLFENISDFGVNQFIYSAIKKNVTQSHPNSPKYASQVSPILNLKDKFLFKTRITKVYNDLEQNVSVKDFDLVHAHLLFTDGAVVLKIFKKYKIPYIVAVRNTDLNIYLKYLKHLRGLAFEILSNAKKVIIISPRYKEKILNSFPKEQASILNPKIKLIPNGIDRSWIDNKLAKTQKENLTKLNFLFVGGVTKNKNLIRSIKLINSLSMQYIVSFTIIGQQLDGYKQLIKLMGKYPWVTYLNPIKDKNILRTHFRNADIFIMLSKHETFGLVYIEALSQGTPILYTKGQGIDGYFVEGKVGYNFDLNIDSTLEFKQKVELILSDYQTKSDNGVKESVKFNWTMVASEYVSIYKDLLIDS